MSDFTVVLNQTPAGNQYDINAEQTFRLSIPGDNGTFEVSHTFAPLPQNEEALLAFDNERELVFQTKGKETDIAPANAPALLNLYKKLVKTCDGYGEEGESFPPNWRELIPADDAIAVINDLLFVDLKEDEDEYKPLSTVVRRRAWGESTGTKTIKTVSYFSGREIFGEHQLKAKTAAEIMAYDRIKGRISLLKNGMRLKPQFKAKAELYDKLIVKISGYAGDMVPVHHKAAVITAYFETDAESATKKSSN